MGALPKEEEYFTYADYKEWDLAEGERIELIYGKIFKIKTPYVRHQEVLGALSVLFLLQFFRV
jgi:hypothetical protein